MVYTVKRRDSVRGIVMEEFEAADKNALYAMLKEKGIVAMSIREGGLPKAGNRVSSRAAWSLVAMVGVIAAVVAVIFLWDGDDQREAAEDGRRKGIREVAPALSAKQAAVTGETAAVKSAAKPKAPPLKKFYTKRHPGEDGHRIVTNNTPDVKGRYEVFKRYPENEIAALLTVTPGTMIIGMPNYNKKFMDDLKASFDDPVVINDDDPEDVKEVKRLVEETKADLKKRMAAGEDIIATLKASREELQRLGLYRNELKDELRKVRLNPEMSEQDVDDFVTAANTLLERNGIAPIELNDMARKAIKFQKNHQKKLKEALKERQK